MFSSNGLQATVDLIVATNTGGLGFNSRFPCDKFLSFTDSSSYVCSWYNASRLIIHDTVKSALSIGSRVLLAASSGLSVRWDSVGATALGMSKPRTLLDLGTSVVLVGPLFPIRPDIGLFSSNIISRCSNWQLDFTSVGGNAGRAWQNVSIAVRGDFLGSNTSLIALEISKQFAQSPVVVIPNRMLMVAEQYTAVVSMCNFLGGCSTRNLSTYVSTNNSVVPTVSILPSSVVLRSRQALTLSSDAYVMLCAGQRSSASLQFSWQMRLTDNITWLSSLISRSKEKSRFTLPALGLLPGRAYLVKLLVRDQTSNLSSTAFASVDVMQSDLAVHITSGGSMQVMRVGSKLLLNASSSFDPDDAANVLTFNWSCSSSPCLLTLDAHNDGVVAITANSLAVNTTSSVLLVVSDSVRAQRNSTATIQVMVIEPTKPLVSMLTASASVAYVNIDQSLLLQCSVLSTFLCNGSWQINPSDHATNSMSFAPRLVSSNQLTIVQSYLPADSLRGGLSYVFSMSCGGSMASISVTTNNPPQGGRLTARPESGFALNTSFLLSTDFWVDADFPLSFTFSFWFSVDRSYLTVRRKSPISTANAILPSGDSDRGGAINVSVIAEDMYGASSDRRLHGVIVALLPSAVAVTVVSNLLLQPDISTDELQNVLSVATTVLNQVPCSSSPNCSSLHRVGCQSTANTCGVCAAGFVTSGKATDDNSPCFSMSEIDVYNASKSMGTCSSSTANCNTWQYCNTTTQTCTVQSKQCSSPSCSAHGRCAFKSSNTGLAATTCSVLSSGCTALCICDFGYAGEDCSLTTAEIASQQAMRSQLMTSLSSVMARTDGDASTLANAASSLYSIVRNQYDLTALLASQVAGFILDILSQTEALSERMALRIASVLAPVNAALQSSSSSNSSSSALQTSNLSMALNAFQELLDKEQQPFSVVYDSFRIVSTAIDTSIASTAGTSPGAFKVVIPLSDAEKAAQSLGQVSTAPTVSIIPSFGNSSSISVFVSVVAVGQSLWKSNSTSLVSEVVTVRANNVDFVDITLHPSNSEKEQL